MSLQPHHTPFYTLNLGYLNLLSCAPRKPFDVHNRICLLSKEAISDCIFFHVHYTKGAKVGVAQGSDEC